jgi:hypothetical protein
MFVGEDVKLIDKMPWPAVNLIAQEILRINKMTPEDSAPTA